ncbi:ABC transporter substrate-binding protein [Schleiferilactobacillus perolens]|jgi:putative ABC transport system substrate-binding protein|nr:ABC transporter substrate-binding protein [Schleiferilactobacillus perolens]
MKKHKRLWLVFTLALALLVSACGNKQSNASGKDAKVKVGILQLMDQSALDQARKGFIAELKKEGYTEGKNLTIDYVNAQNDQSNLKSMSEKLAKDKNTVNVAIATPAAQALMQADKDTPQLFTAITDPVSAGLTTSMKKPSGNVTGTSDMVPVAGQIKLLHQLFPKAKKIGLLYNAAEPNSVYAIKLAQAAIKKLGLQAVSKTVATTADVQQTATALASQVDAIYIPADNVLTAAMATVGKVSEDKKVPVIPATGPMVQLGGVATNGIDYTKLGAQTAQMAVKIIKGKKVADMPVETPKDVSLVVNQKLAKLFKVDPAKVAGDK